MENNEKTVLKWEDFFKEEKPKEKEILKAPKHQKKNFIFALISYIVVMFLVALAVQLIIVQDPNNIEYSSPEDVLIERMSQDLNAVGMVTSEAYNAYFKETELFNIYDSYQGYILFYNHDNTYVRDFKALRPISYLFENDYVLSSWDNTSDTHINTYVNEDLPLAISSHFETIKLVAFEETLIDEVAADETAIALIDQSIYDTYYSSYNQNVIAQAYDNDYYILVNENNSYKDHILASQNNMRLYLTEYDAYEDGTEVNRYTYEEQTVPLSVTPTDLQYFHSIFAMDVQLTGMASGLSNFIIYIVAFGVIVLLLKSSLIFDFKQLKLDGIGKLAIAVIIGYVIIIIGNNVAGALQNILSVALDHPIEEAANQASIEAILHSNGAVFMILSAVILGPVVEELVFRKSIFGLFKNQYVALVISAILFGSIHLLNEATLTAGLVNGISYIVMGFVFGGIYIYYNKNIYYTIAIHMVSNLISILAVLFLL